MFRLLSYLFLLIIALLGVGFACLNASTIGINLYLRTFYIPLSLLIALTLMFGVLIGFIFSSIKVLKLKAENRRILSRIKIAEKEIKNLRIIPIKS